MNLAPEHRDILTQLSEASERYNDVRRHGHARARRQVDAQIVDLRIVRDTLAAQAFDAGIPILRISEDGLHTQSRKTARDAIAEGRRFADAFEFVMSVDAEIAADLGESI